MSPGWSLRRCVSGTITTLCRSVIVPRMNGLNSFRVGWLIIPISDVVVGYFILAGLEATSRVRAAPAGYG